MHFLKIISIWYILRNKFFHKSWSRVHNCKQYIKDYSYDKNSGTLIIWIILHKTRIFLQNTDLFRLYVNEYNDKNHSPIGLQKKMISWIDKVY